MAKKKNRRQVHKQADTAGAREAEFEAKHAAERAKAVQATGVINNAEALALTILADAGWVVESLDNYRGYQLLVSAPGACEQVVEARTAMKLVKAVRELGGPDLYPAVEEYEAELAEMLAEEDLVSEEIELVTDIVKWAVARSPKPPVLVNALDTAEEMWNCGGKDASNAARCPWLHTKGHMSTKVIELPSPQLAILKGAQIVYVSGRGDIVALAEVEVHDAAEETAMAEAGRQVRIIEAARSVYISGRGDFVALAEGENPYVSEGTPIEGNFIQVRDCCTSLGMVFRQTGRTGGMFEYPETEEAASANLFPHPAAAGLFKVSPRGVGTDPISGALIAPRGKTFELTHQIKGLSHRQKTIRSAAWGKSGWVAQVVTL